jgi:hypothetical protein
MSNLYIFYHIYCCEHTEKIITSQINKIIYSGLYSTITTVHCFVTGEPKYVDACISFIKRYGKKFLISAIGYNDTTYERFTLEKIKMLIQPGDKFLYIHSKGVTKPDNKNVADWRDVMEYYLIAQHATCIKDLEYVDVVGIYYSTSISPHFSGNFWWSTANYFLKLPDCIGTNYSDPEMYLMKCSPTMKCYNSLGVNGYNQENPPILYIDQ